MTQPPAKDFALDVHSNIPEKPFTSAPVVALANDRRTGQTLPLGICHNGTQQLLPAHDTNSSSAFDKDAFRYHIPRMEAACEASPWPTVQPALAESLARVRMQIELLPEKTIVESFAVCQDGRKRVEARTWEAVPPLSKEGLEFAMHRLMENTVDAEAKHCSERSAIKAMSKEKIPAPSSLPKPEPHFTPGASPYSDDAKLPHKTRTR